jgi:hypothetical protein
MELKIEKGYCYQVLNRLLEVTTSTSANMLRKMASNKVVFEISKEDALERGFDELANWSIPEYDRLYLIDDNILVCLPKEGGAYY